MMLRLISVYLLLLSTSAFSQSEARGSDDWQQLQTQATQAYHDSDYLLAQQLIQQAIALAEKADNGDAYQASSLNMLAYIYAAQGQTDQALDAIEQAVQLSRQAPEQHQEQLGILLFNQGQLLQQANQLDLASAAYQQSIQSHLAFNSEGEGTLWQAVLAQAQLLMAGHQFVEAGQLLKNALNGFPGQVQFTHQPDAIEDLIDLRVLLAQTHLAQQQTQQAIAVLEQGRQLLQQQTTQNEEQKLWLLELLATAYEDTQQASKALPLREQALKIRQQQTKPSLATVMHLNELAMRFQQDENFAEADDFYQQALGLLAELDQNESIEQALILGNRASLKLLQRETRTALALFEQSFALHQQLNQRPLDASRIAGYAATIYYNQRQYAQAEPLFLEALALLDSVADVNEESLLIALDNLATLYNAWGKTGKARLYSNRARALRNQ